jgi:hypothetical protein
MTLDELKKFSKMYTLSGLSETNPDHHLFISIDVEGWNIAFRRPFCEPIGKHFFDSIFGTNHFQPFLEVYELSDYICEDGTWNYSWEGQLGGIEGLSQKIWT